MPRLRRAGESGDAGPGTREFAGAALEEGETERPLPPTSSSRCPRGRIACPATRAQVQEMGLDVSILVNNAGAGFYGIFNEARPASSCTRERALCRSRQGALGELGQVLLHDQSQHAHLRGQHPPLRPPHDREGTRPHPQHRVDRLLRAGAVGGDVQLEQGFRSRARPGRPTQSPRRSAQAGFD